MRHPLEEIVDHLAPPGQDFLQCAATVPATLDEHERLLTVPALNAVEVMQPVDAAEARGRLRVAAWNLERCKFPAESATLLRRERADICLLTEMDVGMARSGNRHTPAELAAELGMGYAFAVEFIELGLGDDRETSWHAGQSNAVGFHGNAVLSRFPIERAVVVPLDDGGEWFTGDSHANQRRVGGRMALACRIGLDNAAAWVVAAHFESRLTPSDRAVEMRRLVATLDNLTADAPVLLGGDFNTVGLTRADYLPESAFLDPSPLEPCFTAAGEAGFDWRGCNTPAATQRSRPDGRPLPPFTRIDWFFTRGLIAGDPRVIAAVDDEDSAISDHECITVEISHA